jgi:hypothetical protein
VPCSSGAPPQSVTPPPPSSYAVPSSAAVCRSSERAMQHEDAQLDCPPLERDPLPPPPPSGEHAHAAHRGQRVAIECSVWRNLETQVPPY